MPLPDLDTSVGHSFGLEMDGVMIKQISEVTGLKMEQDVIELKQNTADGKYMIKKLPGRPKAGEVTLTRGLTADNSQCGAGNAPSRRFCRRCAAPLTDAEVVRAPWWRRLLSRSRPKPRRKRWLRRSGERPSGKRSALCATLTATARAIRWAVAILLVLGLLAYGLVPGFRGWANPLAATAWNKARSTFSTKYVPIRPTQITSNGELGNHPATSAIDTLTTTYWAVREGGPDPILS